VNVTLRVDRRVLQEVAALATLIAAFVIGWEGKWVFAKTLPVTKKNPTFAQQIFSDRATIGFVRFAIVMLALYVIASVPALVVGGRWLRKGLSTTGATADDAIVDGAVVIADLQGKVKKLQSQRDAAKTLADRGSVSATAIRPDLVKQLEKLDAKAKKTDEQVDRLIERSDRVAERLRAASPSMRRR
jgi:hypothetical protein